MFVHEWHAFQAALPSQGCDLKSVSLYSNAKGRWGILSRKVMCVPSGTDAALIVRVIELA